MLKSDIRMRLSKGSCCELRSHLEVWLVPFIGVSLPVCQIPISCFMNTHSISLWEPRLLSTLCVLFGSDDQNLWAESTRGKWEKGFLTEMCDIEMSTGWVAECSICSRLLNAFLKIGGSNIEDALIKNLPLRSFTYEGRGRANPYQICPIFQLQPIPSGNLFLEYSSIRCISLLDTTPEIMLARMIWIPSMLDSKCATYKEVA